MSKTTKVWLISATLLMVVGLTMVGSVLLINGLDIKKMDSSNYETNIYEIDDEFNNLTLNTDTADIAFALSEDGKCRVECYERVKQKHSVAVTGNSLVINVVDEREIYDYIGINLGTPKITICLPRNEYASLTIDEDTGDVGIPKDFRFENVKITLGTGDVFFGASASKSVKIRTSTGHIRLSNVSADILELSTSTGTVTVNNATCDNDVKITVSTGKSYVYNVKCRNFESTGSTGEITLKNVIANQKIEIVRSTGDVEFKRCDADEVYIKTGTGDVEGIFLTEKRLQLPPIRATSKCRERQTAADVKS
ncbi:MAG: DUF4097 family beta strand repeat protein [Clostridia bacterium]|nr:DUF4097 family beta strand repeat protein [Clostridia bacterium]